jgi:hypothetical protein
MASIINLKLDGDGAWPDLIDKGVIHLGDDTAIGLAVLAAGMTSGRPSVMFRFDLPDGGVVCAEASWRVLAVAAQAIAARYGWPE